MSGYRTPFVRSRGGGWEIVSHHLRPAPWRGSGRARLRSPHPILAALHRPSFLAERAYSAAGFLIQRGRQLAREAGFELVVLSIPSPFALSQPEDPALSPAARRHRAQMDPDYPDRRLAAACQEHGVRFVALKGHLGRADYKPRDDHWTERGHARVAAVLMDLQQAHARTRRRRPEAEPAALPSPAALG
jgi:hypothetical protein